MDLVTGNLQHTSLSQPLPPTNLNPRMVLLPPLLLQPIPPLHPPLPLLHHPPKSLHNPPPQRPDSKTRPGNPGPAPPNHLPLAQNPQHAAKHRHVLAAPGVESAVLGQSGDRGPLDVDARAGGDSGRCGILGQGVDGGVQVFHR